MKQLIINWRSALRTGNIPQGAKMDFVSKWLVIMRAAVVSMTITSVFIGALVALNDGFFNVEHLIIITVVMIFAHLANNLINDFFDYKQGTDTPDYHRTLYSPHPVASGLISERKLLFVFAVLSLLELAAAVYFYLKIGFPVLVFAGLGFLLSVFYVAPPLKLKYRGAGEFAIFLIWGPLITVGTYYVMAGTMPMHAWVISIPYGLVVMNVLLAKHLDKYEKDSAKGVRTFPVVLGFEKAVAFTKINTAMFFIAVVVLVAGKIVTPFVLICFFSIGRFRRFLEVLSSPRPENKPEGFPDLWPLWYVVWAFWFNKLAGGLFITGLIAGSFTKKYFGF